MQSRKCKIENGLIVIMKILKAFNNQNLSFVTIIQLSLLNILHFSFCTFHFVFPESCAEMKFFHKNILLIQE